MHSQAASSDRLLTKATLLGASCFASMVGGSVAAALRDIEAAFSHVPNSDIWVRFILTLPALAIVVGSPIAGWIVDRYGRKMLLVISAALYGFAGVSGFVAPSLGVILVGRAALGLTAAGVMTAVATLITDYYTGITRTRFFGIQAAVMGLSGAVFTSLGGLLASWGWRWPFLIYLLSFLVVPAIAIVVREPARVVPGVTTDSVPRDGSAPSAPEERWPVGFMLLIYGMLMILQVSYYLIPVEFSFYLNDLVGASGRSAGMAVSLITLSFAAGSLYFNRLRTRFSNQVILVAGLALLGAGYTLLGLASGWGLIVIGLPLAGIGFGFAVPNLNVWLADSVPGVIRGRALGLFTTALFLGQFLSPIVTRPLTQAGSVGLTLTVIGALLGAGAVAGVAILWRIGRQGS